MTTPLIKAIQPITEVKKAEAMAGAKIARMPITIKAILRAMTHPRDCLTSASGIKSDVI
jgi:hypothetical protein